MAAAGPALGRSHFRATAVLNAAARMRRYRRRQATGKVLLHVECDEAQVADLLVAAGTLDPLQADDREAIGHAVEKLIRVLAANST
jgi:hypothetical protein